MTAVLAETSAWSRYFRSDIDDSDAVVAELDGHLAERNVVTTGIVYLELLRGFTRERTREAIRSHFDNVPFVEPTREDYADAANLCITCRRAGVQLGSVDGLIAQICISKNLTLLTDDADFTHAGHHITLDLWSPG